jgi:predicted O-methyltransferase YrrM
MIPGTRRRAVVKYDLEHLTQKDSQEALGPIQDDEALFLFATIRVMQLKRVLEIGGLNGYSARNFLGAVGDNGTVFTVDTEPITPLAKNHVTIQKDAGLVTAADVSNAPLDLLFFDCHDYKAQFECYHNAKREGILTDDTVLAFHDTNFHPTQTVPWAYPVEEGWVHQDVERRMVNDFKRMGYDVFVLGTSMKSHGPHLPYRHGITLAKKLKPFILV